MTNIFGLNLTELTSLITDLNLPKFRAKQIIEWLYQKHATSFDEMTNLSKDLREKLAQEFTIERAKSCDRLDSSDGKTTKFLLEFGDDRTEKTGGVCFFESSRFHCLTAVSAGSRPELCEFLSKTCFLSNLQEQT